MIMTNPNFMALERVLPPPAGHDLFAMGLFRLAGVSDSL